MVLKHPLKSHYPINSVQNYVRPIPYTSPFYFFFNQGGHGPLYPLAMPVHAARICQPRVKARERSDRAGGGCGRGVPPPKVGRFLFENSCMKTVFSFSVSFLFFFIFLSPPFFFLSPLFFFSPLFPLFPFFFFLLADQQGGGGGGGHGPLVPPLATPVITVLLFSTVLK